MPNTIPNKSSFTLNKSPKKKASNNRNRNLFFVILFVVFSLCSFIFFRLFLLKTSSAAIKSTHELISPPFRRISRFQKTDYDVLRSVLNSSKDLSSNKAEASLAGAGMTPKLKSVDILDPSKDVISKNAKNSTLNSAKGITSKIANTLRIRIELRDIASGNMRYFHLTYTDGCRDYKVPAQFLFIATISAQYDTLLLGDVFADLLARHSKDKQLIRVILIVSDNISINRKLRLLIKRFEVELVVHNSTELSTAIGFSTRISELTMAWLLIDKILSSKSSANLIFGPVAEKTIVSVISDIASLSKSNEFPMKSDETEATLIADAISICFGSKVSGILQLSLSKRTVIPKTLEGTLPAIRRHARTIAKIVTGNAAFGRWSERCLTSAHAVSAVSNYLLYCGDVAHERLLTVDYRDATGVDKFKVSEKKRLDPKIG